MVKARVAACEMADGSRVVSCAIRDGASDELPETHENTVAVVLAVVADDRRVEVRLKLQSACALPSSGL